jgi:hypothetical protein
MPCGTSTTKAGRHHILLFNKNEKVTESFPKFTNVLDNGLATAYSVGKVGSSDTIP